MLGSRSSEASTQLDIFTCLRCDSVMTLNHRHACVCAPLKASKRVGYGFDRAPEDELEFLHPGLQCTN